MIKTQMMHIKTTTAMDQDIAIIEAKSARKLNTNLIRRKIKPSMITTQMMHIKLTTVMDQDTAIIKIKSYINKKDLKIDQ